MHIIAAPDSFKGSLSAVQAAQAMQRGINAVFSQTRVTCLPLADGGEGTVEALLASGGERRTSEVTGPLGHMRVKAVWAMLPDGTAVLESAAASGLTLLGKNLDAGRATSYGTGELLRAALDAGAKKIIIGLGGSAMTDGGAGLAQALGVKLMDANGAELGQGGLALKNLQRVDLSGLDQRLAKTEITAATDVDNPLCGPHGAAHVFGPQKGATPDMVRELDTALGHYAELARAATSREAGTIPGAGAAGGLGAGLLFFAGARIRPGAELVLDALKFDSLLAEAALVVTGEGQTDFQSARGKLPAAVARAAKKRNVPVLCLSGALGQGYEDLYGMGLDAAIGVPARPLSLEDCMENAFTLLAEAAERACRLLALGRKISFPAEF